MIVYLRDIADYPIVRDLLEQQFPDVPKVIVLAPVCHPGWLIETECIAIKAGGNPESINELCTSWLEKPEREMKRGQNPE